MKTKLKLALTTSMLVLTTITAIVFSSFRAKTPSDSTVTIINESWDNMKLEVRVGNNSVPENNQLVYSGNLPKHSKFGPYTFPSMLYYRREADPIHHDGRWMGWVQCFSSNVITNP